MEVVVLLKFHATCSFHLLLNICANNSMEGKGSENLLVCILPSKLNLKPNVKSVFVNVFFLSMLEGNPSPSLNNGKKFKNLFFFIF